MGSFQDDLAYAIGTDTHLIRLRDMKIPPPDQVIYSPAAVYYSRADYSRVGDGFASINWIWDVLDIASMARLNELLDGEESANVYINSDLRDGTHPNPTFHPFMAVMWKPIVNGQEGVPIARSPYALQSVKLIFMNCVEYEGKIYL